MRNRTRIAALLALPFAAVACGQAAASTGSPAPVEQPAPGSTYSYTDPALGVVTVHQAIPTNDPPAWVTDLLAPGR